MINKTNFSIIIPNYNGAVYLTECLESIFKSLNKTKDQVGCEIILVDNGSTDNSIDVLTVICQRMDFHDFTVIRNNTNLGFATAANQGITKSKYDWVILVNNDLTLHPNWFLEITTAILKFNNTRLAAVFGTVLNKTGDKFESQGLKFFKRGKAINISNGENFSSDLVSKEPYFVWGGSAALIAYKKDLIEKVGMFDEDFFAYEEDVDLALRLHNLKLQVLYVPQAICNHNGGSTANLMENLRSKMALRNWPLIIIKNYPLNIVKTNLIPITEERIRNFSYFIKQTAKIFGYKSIFIIPFQAFGIFFEIVSQLSKTIKKRRQIQKMLQFNQ